MHSIAREKSGQLVLATEGVFDRPAVDALVQAIDATPPEVPLVIDLSNTGVPDENDICTLARSLVRRAVIFRNAGPWHAPILRAIAS